ncbi:hypothetical protein O3G_MSEX000825 [Manduca sexta]|nr:hypothetical protein O3G_MSEX000825 [Manduca sexta]
MDPIQTELLACTPIFSSLIQFNCSVYLPQDQLPSGSNADAESRQREVVIMDVKPEDRATSFFAQPGILAGQYYFIQRHFDIALINKTTYSSSLLLTCQKSSVYNEHFTKNPGFSFLIFLSFYSLYIDYRLVMEK